MCSPPTKCHGETYRNPGHVEGPLVSLQGHRRQHEVQRELELLPHGQLRTSADENPDEGFLRIAENALWGTMVGVPFDVPFALLTKRMESSLKEHPLRIGVLRKVLPERHWLGSQLQPRFPGETEQGRKQTGRRFTHPPRSQLMLFLLALQ